MTGAAWSARPRVGIVGGVGPLAAAHFYRRLIELTPVVHDEDHLATVLVANQVPSRIAHLLGEGPTPVPALCDAVTDLCGLGVGAVVVPSVTTSAYRADLDRASSVPVFDAAAAVLAELDRRGARRPLVLATRATARLRLLDPDGARLPDPATQRRVDRVITAVKAGSAPRAELAALLDAAAASDVDCAVLGCTELSVLDPAAPAGLPVVDATDALARAVLRWCGRSARDAPEARSRERVP